MTRRWWLFWRRQQVLTQAEVAQREDALERVQALERRLAMLRSREDD